MTPLTEAASADENTNSTDDKGNLLNSRETFSKKHKRELLRALTERARQDRCACKDHGAIPKWADYPLTEKHIDAHLDGRRGCGIGLMSPGQSTTKIALLDLDSHNGETTFDDMLLTAERLCAGLKNTCLRPTAFRSSGGAGIHLWMIWDTLQDAYSVRRTLVTVLAIEGFSEGTGGIAAGQVEIFPKQERLNASGPGSNGNMAILPFWNKSEPLVDEFDLCLAAAIPESAPRMAWQVSDGVPQLAQPVHELEMAELAPPDPIEKIARALAAVAPLATELSTTSAATNYDTWRNLLFATHEASGGDEEAFDLFKEWEGQNPVNAGRRPTRATWDRCRDNKEGKRITRGTLYDMAYKLNPEWNAPTADGLPDNLPAPNETEAWPAFQRNTTTGDIKASKDNILQALSRPDICGYQLRHDEFRDETMLAENGTEGWRSLKDTDYTELCLRLERGRFQSISKELIRDVVAYVAEANSFDSAQHWLDRAQWDGKPRIERFLQTYFCVADTPYACAVGLYFWTAAAGRVLQPGIKCDMVPIAVGAQGMRKSSAVAALVPAPDFYTAIDLSSRDDDLARIMRGKLIIELDELKGLSSRDAEYIKSFITRSHEEWTPKYKEWTVRYRRRNMFFGTTNKDDFLADETGNRRWLPFQCGMCDPDAIARDRDQLWAEAREQFKAHGVLHQQAERLAEDEHATFAEHDEWDNVIHKWLREPDFAGNRTPFEREFLTAGEVLREALCLPNSQIAKQQLARVKKSLIRQGYTYVNKRVHGVKKRGFLPPSLF
ncbi:VapE domain-containing protein [Polaromonas sp.]|uniref:VapE domain-containing protein n=1 Tax=Polaromonas sp. TaxID=1869339 RepID=UPI0017B2B924|nr:VapE domain-containing protein [Polaromonas sp.]NML84301.1 hypothetical protein [Polaromonas sp.]